MSAHLLYDIVRKLPDGAEVEIAVADGHAMISAGRSNFRLPTLPVEDFPTISVGDMPDAFAVTAADMRDMIDATRFAISTEDALLSERHLYPQVRAGRPVRRGDRTGTVWR